MTRNYIDKQSVNRREFVLAASATAGLGALAGSVSDVATGGTPTLTKPASCAVGISVAAYQKAWRRAAALTNKMTLDEKISQVGNNAPAIRRIGLPGYQYYAGEALHGLRRLPPVTLFPIPAAMGCTWNPELLRRVYDAVADEARAYHNKYGVCLTYYSPATLNIVRDPRWGRCQEVYGEDPCHLGTLAMETIKGMQGNNPNYIKTSACAKHFICYDIEDDSMRVSASVDPRSFWEYYTRPFRACVDAGVFTVMAAYNAVNGIPCSADRFLLTSLLRKRWRFAGYVTSDCDSVAVIVSGHHYVPTLHQAAALGIEAGCDQNLGETYQQHLRRAVSLNLVSEADISRAVTRALTVRFLLGEFDHPDKVPYSVIGFGVVDSSPHRALALEAARQSIVLLKNENDLLPLNKSTLKSVAIIGPAAGFEAGSYAGFSAVHVSPMEGIAAALGVDTSTGRIYTGEAIGQSRNLWDQGSPGSPTNIQFARIPTGSWLEFPPQDFTGKSRVVAHVSSIAKGGTIAVHIDEVDGPIIAKLSIPLGDWHVYHDGTAPLHPISGKHRVFLRFMGAANDLFKIEWFELLPTVERPSICYEPGCTVVGEKNEAMFHAAVDAAKRADLVVMICGVDQSVDCEGMDRKTIALTGAQHELIRAVHAANPNAVLVLNTNNSVAIDWEQQHIPAIVCSLFAGQDQGTAIAEVLFGRYNPCGKLSTTWFRSTDQLLPFHDQNVMKGRTYMYFEGEPLYPFGFGLSYTTFRTSDMHIDSNNLSANNPIKISCTIKNTGTRAGAEVVQFYITVPKSPLKRPTKELVGFQRVELQPGESRTVTFTLPYTAQALWYWHESQRKFVLQPGILKLMIGSSSADIHLTGEVRLRACTDAKLGGPEMLNTIAVESRVSETR